MHRYNQTHGINKNTAHILYVFVYTCVHCAYMHNNTTQIANNDKKVLPPYTTC